MGNWLGIGAPKFIVEGTAHAFPYCDTQGRVETWVPEVAEAWTNYAGDVVEGRQRFRFTASFKWSALTDAQIENLVGWRNTRTRLLVVPYSDLGAYRVLCRIAKLERVKGATVHAQDVVTLMVSAVSLVDSEPIPDRALAGFNKPKKGVVA